MIASNGSARMLGFCRPPERSSPLPSRSQSPSPSWAAISDSPASLTTCARVFFFQAEDCIRDLYVTGVQTCALPIYRVHDVAGLDLVPPAGGGLLEPREHVAVGVDLAGAVHVLGDHVRVALGGDRAGQRLLRAPRSEEHTSELQSRRDLVCRLLLEKK